MLNLVQLTNKMDRWTRDIRFFGSFILRSITRLIDGVHLVVGEDATRWNKLVPIKINIFHGDFISIVYLP